jgi:hypothetical protein
LREVCGLTTEEIAMAFLREAIGLGRLLIELRPEPEVIGLLSLMLLQESHRAARTPPAGELILLENQDRSLRNREQIAEGVALAERALKSQPLRLLHTAGCDCGLSCGDGIGAATGAFSLCAYVPQARQGQMRLGRLMRKLWR